MENNFLRSVDMDLTPEIITTQELEHLRKKLETQTSMHRLQMLLRMAEVTKLEEHIKCQRRADNIKEEKIGLLTVIPVAISSFASIPS